MENPTRLTAFGNQLIEVHIWLREELDLLRENVDSYLDGRAGRPRQLRTHCLAFCSALTRHHSGEDGGAFPVLAEQFPELRPVLEVLARDHDQVTELLRSLENLLDGISDAPDPAEAQRVRRELDTLAALLETHFTYEEKRIVSALNSLDLPSWQDSTPAFLLTQDDSAGP